MAAKSDDKFKKFLKTKKDKKTPIKKEVKKKLDERSCLINFLKGFNAKNYAVADKYLKEAVDLMLKRRINAATKKNLFK